MNFPFLYIFNCNFSFSCNFVTQLALYNKLLHFYAPPFNPSNVSRQSAPYEKLGTKRHERFSDFAWFISLHRLLSGYISINFGQRFGSALFSIPCHVREFCIMGHDLHENFLSSIGHRWMQKELIRSDTRPMDKEKFVGQQSCRIGEHEYPDQSWLVIEDE